MGDPAETNKHVTVSHFLCDLIENGRRNTDGYGKGSTILDDLENPNTMQLLISIIVNDNQSEESIVASIKVILQLFDDQYLWVFSKKLLKNETWQWILVFTEMILLRTTYN